MPVYDVPGYGKVKAKSPEQVAEKYPVPVSEIKPGKPPSAPAAGRAGYVQVVSKPGAFRSSEPTPDSRIKPDSTITPEEPEKTTPTMTESIYYRHTGSEVFTFPSISGPGYAFEGRTFDPSKTPFYEVESWLTKRGKFVAKGEYKATGEIPPEIREQIMGQIPPKDLEQIEFLEEHQLPYTVVPQQYVEFSKMDIPTSSLMKGGSAPGAKVPRKKVHLLEEYVKSAYEQYLGIETGYARHPFSAYVGEAYKGLSPDLKQLYGFKFTDWGTIPVGERKQYLGAETYFESVTPEQKEKMMKEAFGYQPTEKLSKLPMWKEGIEAHLWHKITLTEAERRDLYYANYPLPTRVAISGLYAFGGAVLWPVTITQLGVKFVTGGGDISKGKPLILPDVAKEYGKLYPGGPAGGIQSWMAEARSQFTGEGVSYEMQQAKKYPLEMGFATFGEVTGLWVGGKALSLGIKGAKLGVGKVTPRVKWTIEAYTGTQLKMPPVKTWLGQYKQASMDILKTKFPPVKTISTFKAKGTELSMMKGSPTTVEGIIAYEGPTISQSIRMGLGKFRGALFEPTARDIMVREGFYSTKFMPSSAGRLPYGKATILDITAWKQMGSYVPSKYELGVFKPTYGIPSKYAAFTEKLATQRILQFKLELMKMPRHIKTETKIITTSEKPYELFFETKRIGRDIFAKGKIVSKGLETKITGIKYYKLSPKDVFYQEQSFRTMVKGFHLKGIGDISATISTGKAVPYIEIQKQLYGYTFKEIPTGVYKPIFKDATKSIGLSLQKDIFAGETRIVGGFLKQSKYDLSAVVSKGIFKGRFVRGTFEDVTKIFKLQKKAAKYYGGTGGFDYTIPKTISQELVMPGGVGIEFKQMTFPSANIFGEFPVSSGLARPVTLAQLEAWEAGIGSSSYWVGIAPSLTTKIIPLTMFATKQISTKVTTPLSIQLTKIQKIQKKEMLNIETSMQKHLALQSITPMTIQKTATSLSQIQTQLQQQMQLQKQQQIQLQKQQQVQLQKQQQIQLQKLELQSLLKLDLLTITPPPPTFPIFTKVTTPTPDEPFIKKPRPWMPWLPFFDEEVKPKRKPEEYDLFGELLAFRSIEVIDPFKRIPF